MIRSRLQPKSLLKNLLAAFLMITVSGAYCLFCCQPASASEAKADHCPTKKIVQNEHCNFSKNKAAEPLRAASSVKAFECCGLKFNFFVAKLEKNDQPQKAPVLANNFFNFLESVKPDNKTVATRFAYRPPALAASDLHIKNRILRI